MDNRNNHFRDYLNNDNNDDERYQGPQHFKLVIDSKAEAGSDKIKNSIEVDAGCTPAMISSIFYNLMKQNQDIERAISEALILLKLENFRGDNNEED